MVSDKALLCQHRSGIDLHGNFRDSDQLALAETSPVERVVQDLSTLPNGRGLQRGGYLKAFLPWL